MARSSDAVGLRIGRTAHHAERQRSSAARRRDEAGDACDDAPLQAGLTGTKLGCDRAECGACTVLIDDIPHYSCSILTHTVRGRRVSTIEGLAEPRPARCTPCSRRSWTSKDSSARSACPAS